MKKTGLAAAALCAAISMTGCVGHFDMDEDAGPQTTKEVKVTGFSKIEANGSFDVTVTVGQEESINLEGNEERIKNFSTKMEGDTLVLKEESSGLFGGTHGKLHVTVTVPKLDGFTVNGSGEATISGVESENFALGVNGSGDISIAGKAAKCSIAINGSGDIDASGLTTKSSDVSIAGSGSTDVNASDALSVSIAGSGDVNYSGDPKVTKSVTGSGDVNKK